MTPKAQTQTVADAGVALPITVDVLDCLPAALLVVSESGLVQYRNARAGNILSDGSTLDAVLASARFLDPFDGWPTELKRVLTTGKTQRLEAALCGVDGSSRVLVVIQLSSIPEAATDHPVSVAVLVTDGAQRDVAEGQLEVSQRLTSLGKLATRVAHELNNPLDGILRYINLAMRLVGDEPESKLRSYLSESRIGLKRMARIIGDLLEYSRTTDGAWDASSINEVVEQAIRSLAAAADEAGVSLAADFQTLTMPFVSGSRFYQVCCNLIKNAIDAMPDGGRLCVTTALIDDEVVVRVSDTGAGLPDPPEKVFEPFFTTKGPGKGTGLGLAICKDFMEDMHGSISVAPGDACGAVFTVRLPIASCHGSPPPAAVKPHRGTDLSRSRR